MWVEINNNKSFESPIIDIEPEPKKEFEVRLVIWEAKGIPEKDIEGTSDVYMRTFFNHNEDWKTDIHWRCSCSNDNGTPSFNYRLLIPTDNTALINDLTIEAWDKDIIMKDDVIGSGQIKLKQLIKDCELLGKPVHLTNEYVQSLKFH